MSRLAAMIAALLAGACAGPPKAIKLAPARVPSPQIRELEEDAAKVRPWKLVAARELAGVLFEEYQLGEQGPKLAVSIDKDARVVVLEAHFLSLSRARLEEETQKIAKATDAIGAIAGGGVSADRAYVGLTFSPKIENGALDTAAKAIVRANAAYSASGAIDRVALLEAMKKALEGPKDTVPSDTVPSANDHRVRREWAIDKATPAEEVALEAAARVLADGPESRLGRALLPRDASAIDAVAGSRSFEIAVELEPGRSSTTATSLIDREVRALARGETTGIEVERARSRVRAELLFELSGIESRAVLAGGALLGQNGGIAALFARFESTEKLDEKALRTAVAKHLKSSMVSTR